MSDEAHPHEIIIIKRHPGGHDDGHHGGAWKIAYADFVTAMMAFFLVMWLISANDKTKAVIARYFNPVQLIDSTPQPPGLNTPDDKAPIVQPKGTTTKPAEAKDTDKANKEGKDAKEPAAGKDPKDAKQTDKNTKKDEADLFKDPYGTLSDIAAKDGPQPAKPAARTAADSPRNGAAAAGTAGQKGGEAFRDPFEPMAIPAPTEPAKLDDAVPPPPARTLADNAPPAAAEPAAAPLPAEPQARAVELKNRIDGLMKAVAAASGGGASPKVDVRATPDGVLIALTDDAKFAMFGSASAEPSPRMVVLMERIGKLLKAQKGKVTVRGFTDSRKFKSDTYDNWRLSSARAHMAHYMLARGGLEDARIDRIEGYADREPRNAKDPESPENRRIEILLKETP